MSAEFAPPLPQPSPEDGRVIVPGSLEDHLHAADVAASQASSEHDEPQEEPMDLLADFNSSRASLTEKWDNAGTTARESVPTPEADNAAEPRNNDRALARIGRLVGRAADALQNTADRRTAREVAAENIVAGRERAQQLGATFTEQRQAVTGGVRLAVETVRAAGQEQVDAFRQRLETRAQAAEQRRTERAERREAARLVREQERQERRETRAERIQDFRNRITEGRQAVTGGVRLAVETVRAAGQEQVDAFRQRLETRAQAAEQRRTERAERREAARLVREQERQERRETRAERVENVKRAAAKAGKVAAIGAGVVAGAAVAIPVAAVAVPTYYAARGGRKLYDTSANHARNWTNERVAGYHENRAVTLGRAIQELQEQVTRHAASAEERRNRAAA